LLPIVSTLDTIGIENGANEMVSEGVLLNTNISRDILVQDEDASCLLIERGKKHVLFIA